MPRFATLLSIAALALPATATAAAYADRTAFLAALAPSPTTITFDGLVGTPGFAPYTTGGFASATGYSLNGIRFNGIAPYFFSYIFNPVSGYSLAGSSIGMFDQFGGDFVISPVVSAFGFDLGSVSGSGAVDITVNRVGAAPVTTSLTLGSGTSFFGYAGAEAITSVNLRDPLNSNFYVKFDNVTFGSLAAGTVPEPATWALMIGGFGLTGAVQRRRRGGRVVAG